MGVRVPQVSGWCLSQGRDWDTSQGWMGTLLRGLQPLRAHTRLVQGLKLCCSVTIPAGHRGCVGTTFCSSPAVLPLHRSYLMSHRWAIPLLHPSRSQSSPPQQTSCCHGGEPQGWRCTQLRKYEGCPERQSLAASSQWSTVHQRNLPAFTLVLMSRR